MPGIGQLSLSKESPSPADTANIKASPLPGLKFTSNTSETTDESLINYIAGESGKMKSLAAADFESYISLAKEILYSGKPFLMEGLGLLSKNKNNEFDFIPENAIQEKNKEAAAELTTATEESFSGFNRILLKGKKSVSGAKSILALVIVVAGIVLAIWAGYAIYKKTLHKNGITESSQSAGEHTSTTPSGDTALLAKPVNHDQATGSGPAPTYRFIIEQAGLTRVLARYNQLKGYGLNIKMASKDSAVYKVFFELPATPADTARIADSLSFLYKLKGERKVWAE